MINFCSKLCNNLSYNQTTNRRILSRYRESKGDVFIRTNRIMQKPIATTENDLQYKKDLCKLSEIPKIKPVYLQSIIGPDEFKDVIIQNSENRSFYVTGERPEKKAGIPDTNKLENVRMKLFGGDYHIHTVNSDGSLTVKDLLSQAVSYGDEYAKINNKPFVVGITDHNTIEGCKQAVQIIAQNPEKYKNIRVVLGVEISTKEDGLNGYTFKKPEKYHILAMCINPFDKKLNDFLDFLQEETHNPMRIKPISIQEAFDGVNHQTQCHFALAHPAYPDLGHRVRDDKDVYETLRESIAHFKDITKERGLYSEGYYSSYFGNLAIDRKMYDTVIKACDDFGLYKAGGIDCHGESIFYNGQSIKHK